MLRYRSGRAVFRLCRKIWSQMLTYRRQATSRRSLRRNRALINGIIVTSQPPIGPPTPRMVFKNTTLCLYRVRAVSRGPPLGVLPN